MITNTNQFVNRPKGGIVLDNATLCQESDLDRMNAFLFSEHAFNSL